MNIEHEQHCSLHWPYIRLQPCKTFLMISPKAHVCIPFPCPNPLLRVRTVAHSRRLNACLFNQVETKLRISILLQMRIKAGPLQVGTSLCYECFGKCCTYCTLSRERRHSKVLFNDTKNNSIGPQYYDEALVPSEHSLPISKKHKEYPCHKSDFIHWRMHASECSSKKSGCDWSKKLNACYPSHRNAAMGQQTISNEIAVFTEQRLRADDFETKRIRIC